MIREEKETQHSEMAPTDPEKLELARASAKAALEELVQSGIITRYEEWDGFDEEDDLDLDEDIDALYFVAYSKSPMSVRRRLAELSSRLTREHKVPVFIVTFKELED